MPVSRCIISTIYYYLFTMLCTLRTERMFITSNLCFEFNYVRYLKLLRYVSDQGPFRYLSVCFFLSVLAAKHKTDPGVAMGDGDRLFGLCSPVYKTLYNDLTLYMYPLISPSVRSLSSIHPLY